MGFPKEKNDVQNLGKVFKNADPADPNSNKAWQSGSKKIGPIKGRITTSKTSVSSLNTGVLGHREK